MDNKTKYFFISAAGTRYIDMSSLSPSTEEMDEVEKLLNSSEEGKKMKGKLPITSHNNVVMESPTGLFVPSIMENYIRNLYKLDEVCITFVRELTKEEYEFDKAFKTDLTKAKPLGQNLLQEIDDILNLAEKGDLRVIKPESSDLPKTEEEAELRSLNLPDNLFSDEGLWEDDNGDK